MVQNKHKNHTNTQIERIASIVGTTAMLAATICGVVEHMQHDSHRMVLALQPAYASAAHHAVHAEYNSEELRRAGREEIHHSSASYGAVKRTPSVAGAI